MIDPEAIQVAEKLVVQALLPYKDRLPADTTVIALLRCARVLLRKLPAEEQRALLPACRAYLEGKVKAPALESENLILLH
jgi:hypothetical protein